LSQGLSQDLAHVELAAATVFAPLSQVFEHAALDAAIVSDEVSQGLLHVRFEAATVAEALSQVLEHVELEAAIVWALLFDEQLPDAAETFVEQAVLLAFTSVEEQLLLPSLNAAGIAIGNEASTVVNPADEPQGFEHTLAHEAFAFESQAPAS
jgi:hypothetical protein